MQLIPPCSVKNSLTRTQSGVGLWENADGDLFVASLLWHSATINRIALPGLWIWSMSLSLCPLLSGISEQTHGRGLGRSEVAQECQGHKM